MDKCLPYLHGESLEFIVMFMHGIFFDITIIIVLAAILAIIFRLLKQPPVLAYILAGIILGPLGLYHIENQEALSSLSEVGITLLLFMLGLELKLGELRSVGKVALITGIGQIVFTSSLGFLLAVIFGIDPVAALYFSVALTFSSTIIIVKLLSDKKDLGSLYGKISIGFLLVQDFFAIIALILLSGLSTSSSPSFELIGIILLKASALFLLTIFLSNIFFPRLVHALSHSQEILFLSSLALAFGVSAFASSEYIGFSIEIGGFLAGLALANSIESTQIVAKIRSLRDFFIVLFFVLLGMNLVFADIASVLPTAIVFSLFVLIGNPLIVMILLGLLGYKKRTSFLAGLTVAQISEFSLIVIFLGNRIGHVPDEIVSLVTLVGIITFTLSTYAIMNGNTLFNMLQKYLGIFEKSKTVEKGSQNGSDYKNHIIIIGAHRIGGTVIKALAKYKDQMVIVDFNPDIIQELKNKNFNVVFGDIADPSIQEEAKIDKARIIFSTAPDYEDNIIIIRNVKRHNTKGKVLVSAQYEEDIQDLYEAGADYVFRPFELAGKSIARILKPENSKLLAKLEESKSQKEKSS